VLFLDGELLLYAIVVDLVRSIDYLPKLNTARMYHTTQCCFSPRQVHPPKSYLLSHREEILYPCTSRLQKGKRQHRSKQRLKTDKTSSKLVAASTHPVKSNGIYSIKCMGTKLAATVEEKEESLQSKDKEHQIQQMSMRVDALVRERDAARYEMEKVINR
jgi:hypothetical protein